MPTQPVEETGRYVHCGKLTLDLYRRHALLFQPDTMVMQEAAALQPIAIPPTTFDFLVILARHSPNPVYESLVGEAQNYTVTRAEARDIVRWQIHEAVVKLPSAQGHRAGAGPAALHSSAYRDIHLFPLHGGIGGSPTDVAPGRRRHHRH